MGTVINGNWSGNGNGGGRALIAGTNVIKVPNGLRMDWSGLDSPVIVKSGPRL